MVEIFNDILILLGGATIVLSALFGLIGKLLISRATEEIKHSFQIKVAALQSDLAKTNKKLDAELQRAIYIDKAQFDYEFQIYRDVWNNLVDLQAATLNLRPVFDYIDPAQSKEDRMQERLSAFIEPFNKFLSTVEKNKPFYSPSVYASLSNILKLCRDERIDFEYIERSKKEYFEEAKKNREDILKSINQACEEIRGRINEVKVINN